MKEFELINPSDPYTFFAENDEVAVLTVQCISSFYGAKAKDNSFEVPVFIFGGANEWYKEHYNRTLEDGTKLYIKEIADALESMMYGDFEERKRYQAALNAIDDDVKKQKFIEEWQDGISSLNDIGTYAHKLAFKLKEQLKNPL